MDLIEFETNVTSWAHDRNLIEGTTTDKQFIKLVEEQGEAWNELFVYQDKKKASVEVGDMFVVAVILCAQKNVKLSDCIESAQNLAWPAFTNATITVEVGYLAELIAKNKDDKFALQMGRIGHALKMFADIHDMNYEECAELVWNKIENRKGRMIDGYYVKEDDIK